MRTFHCFRWLAVTLACVNWILPLHCLWAAPPVQQLSAPARSATQLPLDIALTNDGRLLGQVMDVAGRPVTQQVVTVQNLNGGMPRQATTNRQGQFSVEGLRGGVFQVMSNDSMAVCRCWTAQAAPPVAKHQLLLVSDGQLQRGQKPIGELFFSNPVLLGLIIAAAIAIPIAIHNSQDDDSASQ